VNDADTTSAQDIRQRHRAELRLHAIELLRQGHSKLDPAALANAEEEHITGWLKERIEAFIETDADAPNWVEHYTVYDEEKPSGTTKSGKDRPRIDITIKRSWKRREEHPRFRFEAKRLKADGRIGAYFGKEGIGCFLRGTYPLTHPEAAMIGYVQSGAVQAWHDKLGAYAKKNARRLRTNKAKAWSSYETTLPESAISEHRTANWNQLQIVHLLLSCHPAA
jgi:hypothetical protein